MKTFKKTSSILMALIMLLSFTSYANTPNKSFNTKEYRVKGLVIFSMIKYIQWPESSDELVIGLLSDNVQMLDLFKEIATERSTDSKKITIKAFNTYKDGIAKADILFVPSENSKILESMSSLSSPKALIITEKDGLAKKGSAINLVNIDGKLRFEINRKAVENAAIKISSKLIDMGIEV